MDEKGEFRAIVLEVTSIETGDKALITGSRYDPYLSPLEFGVLGVSYRLKQTEQIDLFN